MFSLSTEDNVTPRSHAKTKEEQTAKQQLGLWVPRERVALCPPGPLEVEMLQHSEPLEPALH